MSRLLSRKDYLSGIIVLSLFSVSAALSMPSERFVNDFSKFAIIILQPTQVVLQRVQIRVQSKYKTPTAQDLKEYDSILKDKKNVSLLHIPKAYIIRQNEHLWYLLFMEVWGQLQSLKNGYDIVRKSDKEGFIVAFPNGSLLTSKKWTFLLLECRELLRIL